MAVGRVLDDVRIAFSAASAALDAASAPRRIGLCTDGYQKDAIRTTFLSGSISVRLIICDW
jgi:hypothetical protein